MNTVFIDYAQFFYRDILKTDLPPFISGKFVQIKSGSTEYFVFSPKEFTKYHANIVERFCLDHGIEGSYDTEGKRYDIQDRQWIIAGGGKYEIDARRRSIKLFDDSMGYGKFDAEGFADKIKSTAEFKEFSVHLD